MCQGADEVDLMYAEEVNTVSLLQWHKVVLFLLRDQDSVDEGVCRRLLSGLVDGDKLLDSLYQPYKIVESMVENLERMERACSNMRTALRPQASEEEHSAKMQEATIRVPPTAVKTEPEKQASRVIRLRLNRRAGTGILNEASPAQIMQGSQDVATATSPLSEGPRDGDTVNEVLAGHTPAARTTAGDTTTTDSDPYVVKPRKSWGRMRKFPQSTYDAEEFEDEEIEVDWEDNSSNPPWKGYCKSYAHARPFKKRKYIKITTGDESDVSS